MLKKGELVSAGFVDEATEDRIRRYLEAQEDFLGLWGAHRGALEDLEGECRRVRAMLSQRLEDGRSLAVELKRLLGALLASKEKQRSALDERLDRLLRLLDRSPGTLVDEGPDRLLEHWQELRAELETVRAELSGSSGGRRAVS